MVAIDLIGFLAVLSIISIGSGVGPHPWDGVVLAILDLHVSDDFNDVRNPIGKDRQQGDPAYQFCDKSHLSFRMALASLVAEPFNSRVALFSCRRFLAS